ncbi:phospholipase A [Halomonas ramblicola]|uniref:phospholipase A n=1 Tax=Halomonas ramblicola TaxID=747349 RepID=UPI0025B53F72|nr:phospholipase A [Halomonas ramblicola]MDN3520486.1 phospholipase A [Halomonas ramblicola]
MRPPLRSLLTTATALILLAGGGVLQAQETTEAERAVLESRIDDLRAKLESLQQQLQALPPADEDATPHRLEPDEVVAVEAAERRQLEQESERNPFAITTYRRNYLLPVSYNTNPNGAADDATDLDNAELKFQFSAKVSLAEGLFGDTGDLYFGYTQRSWWQAYNSEASSPFRETNYEPEVFVDFDNDWGLLGWTNVLNRVSVNHQSNGRSDPESRSWNRLYLESVFQRGDWAVSLAPHWRLPDTTGEDDNPDIERYMGYGDVTLARRFGDNELSLLWRGNPSAGNMGTQLDYSWPLFDSKVRGHIQYYHGYGESLIDYDHRSHRLSLGFSLNPLFTGGTMTR